jgi:hypothetical protein
MSRPLYPPVCAPFPATRLRRNRRDAWSRGLVAESRLDVADLIWPVFVLDGECRREPVASMPGIERLSVDELLLALTEAMGRLVSCGFEIVSHERQGYHTYILARKTGSPVYDMSPTYGLLVKLDRVGQDGKKMHLYKVRTMHPYSEYLQEYLYNKNGTANGDKIIDDFRVTGLGGMAQKILD